MEIKNWITISNRGTARLTKSRPRTEWNEISMLLNIDIPDSVFQRPLMTANIKIDGELNYEFNYEEKKKIEDVLSSLPNVHLLNITVENKEKESEN